MRWAQNYRRVELHGVDTRLDYFEVDNVTYQALPLDDNSDKGLGINSSVFRAVLDDNGDTESLVVKVCNYPIDLETKRFVARRGRFEREINAMRLSITMGKENLVVALRGAGFVEVQHGPKKRTHQCFLMEAAHKDLKEHLDGETAITLQQRLLLCSDLIRSVGALHEIGVYHRDIKPANVLLCRGGWKIGDLGLVGFRDEDADAESREKIGPPPWMSPEAFNKAYCVRRPNNGFVDVCLDERSDVFQLGKVCWHILQGDIPNGCLKRKDLVEGGESLFGTFLKPMLRYQRSERPLLSEIQRRLVPILRQHSVQ